MLLVQYLSSSKYDGLAKVFQHERQRRSCIGHSISTMQYNKTVVLRVVRLSNHNFLILTGNTATHIITYYLRD